MQAPTVSKVQEKRALSSKKKKKETIKNVLTKPYRNHWPSLTPEDNNQVKDTLERLLPRVKNPKINIPYEEIKRIPKEERKKFREKFFQQPPIELEESEKQKLVFGVNDTTRLLEKQEIECVLIADNVQPRLLVQHVIDQAVVYNVPVLVVENLRNMLNDKCGISSAVFALRKPITADSNLGLLQQIVYNMAENYPVSQDHIHYSRKLGDITTITISDAESDINRDSIMIVSDSETEQPKESTNYHLKRKSSQQRVFVPEKIEKIVNTGEFISLNDSVSVSTPKLKTKNGNIKKKHNYKSLVVKRLKGDKNRNKRKMEKFKKKNK